METEMQQQPPQVRSNPYLSPMHNYGGSIILLTNPDDELYKLELSLRNMMLNQDGEAIFSGEPLMNELGISSILGQVQSITNRNTHMSNFESKMVYLRMMEISDTMIKDLMVNRVKYAIENLSTRDKILTISSNYALASLNRSLEQGERRFWKGSQQEITTRIESQNQKTGGILSKITGWGK